MALTRTQPCAGANCDSILTAPRIPLSRLRRRKLSKVIRSETELIVAGEVENDINSTRRLGVNRNVFGNGQPNPVRIYEFNGGKVAVEVRWDAGRATSIRITTEQQWERQ
jgi:hypothetical protein